MSEPVHVESRAFPLRPAPDPTVRFAGTYRAEAWRRCGAMSAADGIRFTPWPHADYPNWSLPALDAAKCVAKQGEEAFARLHLRLYAAFFTESRNIADREEVTRIVEEAGIPTVIVAATGRSLVGLADLTEYRAAVEAASG